MRHRAREVDDIDDVVANTVEHVLRDVNVRPPLLLLTIPAATTATSQPLSGLDEAPAMSRARSCVFAPDVTDIRAVSRAARIDVCVTDERLSTRYGPQEIVRVVPRRSECFRAKNCA